MDILLNTRTVMLRNIRITLALLCFAAITLLFLDFTGTLHVYLGWLAKVQFLPAVLAVNLLVVAVLLVLTLLLGRVYCSVVCPLGVMQDVIAWLGKRGKKHRNRYFFSPEKRILRYGVLTVFLVCLVAGIAPLVALLAPYSSYGRIASSLFAPLYKLGNNLLALFSAHFDSYAFYSVDVWLKSLPTLLIALVTFFILAVLAWRGGRTYCNTICPVGTVLSVAARFAVFRPEIDGTKCKGCSLCSRRCKAACIDYKSHRIDHSRCVACMDCLGLCKFGAIAMKAHIPFSSKEHSKQKQNVEPTEPIEKIMKTSAEKKPDGSRRSFLLGSLALTTATVVKAQQKKVDGGLAVIEDKQIPQRSTPIVPPGAKSLDDFTAHCTACQLCVSECPNDVLRPSSAIDRLMQPEMQYERGYCRPECTRCSEVCPAGAILSLKAEEKSSTRIGHAVWVKKNCIPLTDGASCGNCARHCPSGAIQMVGSEAGNPDSPMIPVVNTERCIGCGACENLCPARPFSAIYVEGNLQHSRY